MDWVNVAVDTDRYRAVMNVIRNLRVPCLVPKCYRLNLACT